MMCPALRRGDRLDEGFEAGEGERELLASEEHRHILPPREAGGQFAADREGLPCLHVAPGLVDVVHDPEFLQLRLDRQGPGVGGQFAQAVGDVIAHVRISRVGDLVAKLGILRSYVVSAQLASILRNEPLLNQRNTHPESQSLLVVGDLHLRIGLHGEDTFQEG